MTCLAFLIECGMVGSPATSGMKGGEAGGAESSFASSLFLPGARCCSVPCVPVQAPGLGVILYAL